MNTESCFLVVKRPGREADHSPSSSVGSYTSTSLYSYVCMWWCSIHVLIHHISHLLWLNQHYEQARRLCRRCAPSHHWCRRMAAVATRICSWMFLLLYWRYNPYGSWPPPWFSRCNFFWGGIIRPMPNPLPEWPGTIICLAPTLWPVTGDSTRSLRSRQHSSESLGHVNLLSTIWRWSSRWYGCLLCSYIPMFPRTLIFFFVPQWKLAFFCLTSSSMSERARSLYENDANRLYTSHL
jgi:hypothetical protein